MKVITVTLNPSLDKTLYFDGRFTPGTLNRAKQAVEHAGGKGINVARMYRLLDLQATAFGFLGGDNGNILAKKNVGGTHCLSLCKDGNAHTLLLQND